MSRECDGWTPLHFAVKRAGYPKIIDLLASHSSKATLEDVLHQRPPSFQKKLKENDPTLVKHWMTRLSGLLESIRLKRGGAPLEGNTAKQPKISPEDEDMDDGPLEALRGAKPSQWPADVEYVSEQRICNIRMPNTKGEREPYLSPEDFYKREFGMVPGVHFVGKKNLLSPATPKIEKQILRVISKGTDPRVEVRLIDDPAHPVKSLSDRLVAEVGREKHNDYGLFVKRGQVIPKDTIICEYLGEIRTTRQMLENTNWEVIEKKGMTRHIDRGYHFPLEYSQKWAKGDEGDMLGVDAQFFRNEGGMCNDYWGLRSNPANRRVQNADFVEYLVSGWPHVFLVALDDIPGDAEVLADYGEEYWNRMEYHLEEFKRELAVDEEARADERAKILARMKQKAEELAQCGKISEDIFCELVACLEGE